MSKLKKINKAYEKFKKENCLVFEEETNDGRILFDLSIISKNFNINRLDGCIGSISLSLEQTEQLYSFLKDIMEEVNEDEKI